MFDWRVRRNFKVQDGRCGRGSGGEDVARLLLLRVCTSVGVGRRRVAGAASERRV